MPCFGMCIIYTAVYMPYCFVYSTKTRSRSGENAVVLNSSEFENSLALIKYQRFLTVLSEYTQQLWHAYVL